MKCQEVNKLLLAYLNHEVTPSERMLIRAHLVGCDACQQELAALSALQSRVRQSLQVSAAQVAPSPQAWNRLQARLTGDAQPSLPWFRTWFQRLAPGVGRIYQTDKRGVKMKKGLAFTAIAALVIALAVMAFVPAVRAQVGELLRWFRFESPAGGGEVSIPGSVEFTPLRPTYLPAGFQAMAVGLNPEAASLNYWNSSTNQILIIDELRVPSDGSLPPGRKVTVNGQPAVLITGLEGDISFVFLPPTPSAPITPPAESDQIVPLESVPVSETVETVSYTDGRQLIWHIRGVEIRMLSNLPEEEMIKIAESMAPAEEESIE